MNWNDAVVAMRDGHAVRRVSESVRTIIEAGVVPIYDAGTEPIQLMSAWSDDDKPVRFFSGAWSRTAFIPSEEYRTATDWIVVDKGPV